MFLSTKKTEPAHYMLKIEFFSILSEDGPVKVESDVFVASGHKWRLDLYPKGSKEEEKGANHISLYLTICNTESLPKGWKVDVYVKFFVYDHIGQHYISFDDINGDMTTFHEKQMKWGFEELISLHHFKESRRGYLFNDSCVFGAEVFAVPKSTLKDRWLSFIKQTGHKFSSVRNNYLTSEVFEVGKVTRYMRLDDEVDIERIEVPKVTEYTLKDRCLSMIKPVAPMNTYSWVVDNFSTVKENHLFSEVFKVGKLKWTLLLYPKGNSRLAGEYLSIFLYTHEARLYPAGWRVYAKFEIRVKNQSGYADTVTVFEDWFCKSAPGWGCSKFMQLSDFSDTTKGFLLNDSVIIEAKISVIGLLKDFI